MLAHWHRLQTGEGQYVDYARHGSGVAQTMTISGRWDLNREIQRRAGPFGMVVASGAKVRGMMQCKDGVINLFLMGGMPPMARHMQGIVRWMDEDGMAPDWLKEMTFLDDYDMRAVTQDVVDRVENTFQEWFLTKTKAELNDGAVERGLLLAPVNNIKDVWENPHLRARDYWLKVEHPELGATLDYPGPFLKISETPWSLRKRAPLIGEHNLEIYEKELGLSKERIILLKQAGVI